MNNPTKKIPIEIVIRNMPDSTFLENKIHEKAEKLSEFYHSILSCKVVVDIVQKHQHQGKLYNAVITVYVPNNELVVNHKTDENAYIVIRDSFDAMYRKLEEYAEMQHGKLKSHPSNYSWRRLHRFARSLLKK